MAAGEEGEPVVKRAHEEYITYEEFRDRVKNLFCQPTKTMVDIILGRD